MKKTILLRVLNILFFAGFTLSSIASNAQSTSDEIWFRHYGLKDGLPNTSIYEIAQAPDGFLWFSTQNGIVRFDGSEFTRFLPSTAKDIRPNLPDQVLIDDRGGIWVGYQDHFLIAQFDSVAGDFIYHDMNKATSIEGGIQHTRLLGIDKYDKLWVSLIRFQYPGEPLVVTIDTKSGVITDIFADENERSLFGKANFYRIPYGFSGISPFLATDDGVWLGAEESLHFIGNDGNIKSYLEHENGDSFGTPGIDVINDKIWASTSRGVKVYNEQEDRFISHELMPDAVNDTTAFKSYQDMNGNIWITSLAGSFRIKDGKLEDLSSREDLSSLPLAVLYPKAEDKRFIWFLNKNLAPGPNRSDGISLYDKTTDTFTQIRANADISESLKSNDYISAMMLDNSGNLWVGDFYSGLSVYSPTYRRFKNYYAGISIQQDTQNHAPITVAEAPDGKIWSGTTNGRIYISDLSTGKTIKFHQFDNLGRWQETEQNYVTDIYFQQEGIAWVATEWSGLQRISYHPDNKEIQKIEIWIPKSGKDGYLANIPLTIQEGDDNNLWIGTAIGLAEYSFEDNEFTNYELSDGPFDPYHTFGHVSTKSSDGRIWFYKENGAGLKSIQPKTKEVTRYNLSGEVPEEHAFSEFSINDVLEDKDGNIIAAYNGLYLLNEEKGEFETLLDHFRPTVTAIEQDEDGLYVAGTYGMGVYWIDKETGVKHVLNEEEGLANDLISGIAFDEQQRLWIIHALGLSVYNPADGQLINYNEEHGLKGAASETPVALYTTESGLLAPVWLSNNLAVFQPNIPTNAQTKGVKITSVSTFNDNFPVISEGEIAFAHNFGELTISFSSPDFVDSDNTEYRYRFTGQGQSWSPWSTNRSAQFAGLSPGSYTFEVQSRNGDGILSATTASYTFTVSPPWHKTTLAYLLYGMLGIGGVIFGAIRYSSYRTSQTNMRMQAEQAEQLAKIDQMKTNLLINISHELRTPLTLVLGPIEQLRTKATDLNKSWKQQLNIAWRNGKRLQQLVEQVLDLSRLDSQRLELKPRPIELTSFLKRTLESFDSMADQYEVALKIEAPPQDVFLQADPDKFEKIIMNLISNAIKFTPAKGFIKLSLEAKQDAVQIEIMDTGRGIERERLPLIFDRFHSTSERISGGGHGLGVGLSITKEFIELHDGTISVESTPGRGTTFILFFPNRDYGIDVEVAEEVEGPTEVTTVGKKAFTSKPSLNKHEVDNDAETILIVEDNDDMRMYISDLLKDDKKRIQMATNGADGKKQLSLNKPDLIITDIMMPEMDGFEFTKHVRSVPEHRLTPVVMLSARAAIEDRIHGYEVGISDYLVKPFNEQELRARVNNLLKLKHEREQFGHQSQDEEVEESSAAAEFVQKLQQYIEENIQQDDISVERLSEEVNMSRRQLYRKLKAATGFTPAELVREIKLNKARNILERKQKQSIAEVAYAVGFSTPSYFSRLFKSRFGCSPKDYFS